MARETKRIVERFDTAVSEISRLSKLGYSLVPLSVKLVGIIMYATMEINSDQLTTIETKSNESVVETENKTVDLRVDSTTNPVGIQVKTPKQPRTPKVKNA